MFSLIFLSRSAKIEEASCSIINNEVVITPGADRAKVAWAAWEDSIEEVGWYKFSVETNETYSDEDQFRCAGALDGYLGQHRIFQRMLLYKDQMELPRDKPFPQHWEEWMQRNLDWTTEQSKNKADKYWNSISLILEQFRGLHEGYSLKAPVEETLRPMDLFFLQSVGDVYDLVGLWDNKHNELWHMECSGLVALTPDYKDLFLGHSTWSSYLKMHQVLKTYNIKARAHPNKRVSVSTRMGAIGSSDDFWLNDAGLMIFETTNDNFNKELFKKITEKSCLNWVRTLHAAWSSTGAEQWTQEFVRENSGTYNNQYVCVDTKMFIPGKKPQKGMFWVIETMPQMYRSQDATDFLVEHGYFPSFNTPWFEDIFNIAGYPEKMAEAGELADFYSYYNNSRYLIFKQEAPKIKNYEDFKAVMRRNKYKTDIYGHHDPAQQLLPRYDLRVESPSIYGTPKAFGGLDTKVASAVRILHNLTFEANGSPMHDDEIKPWEWGLPPFDHIKYDGLPKKWDFDWINFSAYNNKYDRCDYQDVSSCTAVERCGWCYASNKCFVGTSEGPLDEKCYDGWYYPEQKAPLQPWAVPVVISVSVISVVVVSIIYIMAAFCDPTKAKKVEYDMIK